MHRRDFLRYSVVVAGATLVSSCTGVDSSEKKKKPNIVLVFLDDSGWSDFEPFGKQKYKTPNVKALADEGAILNRFYVPQAICSASRAALLSGCYPGRTKAFGAHSPGRPMLGREYKIISELLKPCGYKTACFGKWHIGDVDGQRPWDRGFDESYGILYSNNMWKHRPDRPERFADIPLRCYENGKVVIEDMNPSHQKQLTKNCTNKAVDFIQRHKNEPFFLYVPHPMPHVPLYVSEEFEGKSGAGLYGDVIMELDWSIGRINDALKECSVERDTLFIFTSDNGPWLSYGAHAGQSPWREGKLTSFDGGLRNACIMKYPGKIPVQRICNQFVGSVDIMPTIAAIAGAQMPDNEFDGENVWQIITNVKGAETAREYYPFSCHKEFQGIISADGIWKLHIPHGYDKFVEAGAGGRPGRTERVQIDWALFNLTNDPTETTDVKNKNKQVFEKLSNLAAMHAKRFYPNQIIEPYNQKG